MVNRGLKSGTVSAYGSGVKLFFCWFDRVMGVRGHDVCDMNEDMWILYISFESLFVSSSSISAKLSALKEFFLFEFGLDPFKIEGKPMHRLDMTRRQLKLNECASKKRFKFSVTKEVLRDGVREYIDMNLHDGRVLWAILCLEVSCLFRLSELVWTGAGQVKKLVRRSALELGKFKGMKRGVLHLDDTKTKLHGDVMKSSFFEDGTIVCPWKAVTEYLNRSMVPIGQGDALFKWSNGKVVRAREFSKRLRAILERGGVSMKEYAGFSLRRGGALSMALIRAVGRWKSYAYRIYIDLTEQEKVDAQLRAAKAQSKESWAAIMVRCGQFRPDQAWYSSE